jgi:diguanylate cyclase (GGDEF)-like protein/PAS domain S-box-containing protein
MPAPLRLVPRARAPIGRRGETGGSARLPLNEKRFQAIYDSVNDGIFIQDPETGTILDVNHRLCEWFDYSLEKMLTLDLGSMGLGLWPYTQETAREWARKAAAGTPQTFEWLCSTRGGNLLWLEVNIRNADIGGQTRLVVTAGNITQRKRTEMENTARLKRAEAQNAVSLALAGVGSDYEAALKLIAHHLAVQVGDLCTLNLVGEDGLLYPSEVAQPYVGGDALLPAYRDLPPLDLGQLGTGQVALSGQALRLENRPLEEALALVRPEFRAYFERFRIHSMLIVPMRTEGRTIGTIALAMGGASRPYSVEDQAVIQNLADRAGLTITNARLYAENLAQATELRKTNLDLERRVEQRTAELERANARLQLMAMEDGLTRLANRRHFDDVLEKEIRRAMRRGDHLALIMADVDFFKKYNDLYGHVAGDGCLQTIGEVMKEVFRRGEELPARYGGEEFAVILPGADAERAQQAAEMLLKAVEARRIPHGNSEAGPWVTLSLGYVSARVTAGTTPDWFITWADEGLYRSKSGGRNRVSSAN